MMEIVLGIGAIGILLYILRPFEWEKLAKGPTFPRGMTVPVGAGAWKKIGFFLLKAICALGWFFWLCAKCALKLSPKIGPAKKK